jgi:hypothetical protein
MGAHLVDHYLQMLLLAWLKPFFRQPESFVAALEIDQLRQQPRAGLAQEWVKPWPEDEEFDPTREVKKNGEQRVQKPENHRPSPFSASAAFSSGCEGRLHIVTDRGKHKNDDAQSCPGRSVTEYLNVRNQFVEFSTTYQPQEI